MEILPCKNDFSSKFFGDRKNGWHNQDSMMSLIWRSIMIKKPSLNLALAMERERETWRNASQGWPRDDFWNRVLTIGKAGTVDDFTPSAQPWARRSRSAIHGSSSCFLATRSPWEAPPTPRCSPCSMGWYGFVLVWQFLANLQEFRQLLPPIVGFSCRFSGSFLFSRIPFWCDLTCGIVWH